MHGAIISSVQNPTIKHIKKLLASGKYRREEALSVAEGVHLASSYIQSGQLPDQVIYAESALHNHEIIEIIENLNASKVPSLVVKDDLFESISKIHASVGLVMLFKPTSHVIHEKLSDDSLLLEDVQDPGNLGTILRTAAAAGVERIYLSAGSASPWSPKSLRAGMGAQFGLKIYENANLVSLATGSSIPVIATDLTAKGSLHEAKLSKAVAWVFGSEGQGLSNELLAACSQRIKIPQMGSTIESLNVSAAVAICLFEQLRQRAD